MPRLPALIVNIGFIFSVLWAQEAQKPQPAPTEQAPPEEDEEAKPKKEYTFNPLQAEKEMKVGVFYFRKGSYKAAEGRFREALKWNPALAEAYLRLGETAEKLHDAKAERQAYAKYIELAPQGKNAESARKKLASLPAETAKETAKKDK